MRLVRTYNEDGTSQKKRLLRELLPDYFSPDERKFADLLLFAQQYASNVVFYNEDNQPSGVWSAFLANVNPQSVLELITNEIPKESIYNDDTQNKLTAPHRVLFYVFLLLLRYPQEQFQNFTERHLNYYYKNILRSHKKKLKPDQVHVIFELQDNIENVILEKDALLNAGTDSNGNEIIYSLDQSLNLNQARIAAIYSLCLKQDLVNLAAINNEYNKSDKSFENMLRWALGSPNQGDPLPLYPTNVANNDASSNIDLLKYLYNELNASNIDPQEVSVITNYILNYLCFPTVDDFLYVMDVHIREIAAQTSDQLSPRESEWQTVYKKIEKAFAKKINFQRRDALKEIHFQYGFNAMMQFALGDPMPNDPLPSLPNGYKTLNDLTVYSVIGEYYIKDKLKLTFYTFNQIMDIATKYQNDRNNDNWQEVYRLIVEAQVKKRNLTNTSLSFYKNSNIKGYQIFNTTSSELFIPRQFHPFDQQENDNTRIESLSLGILISSKVLNLSQGQRLIALYLICNLDEFNYELLNETFRQDHLPFECYLTGEKTWLNLPAEVALGNFVVGPSDTSYALENFSLFAEATSATFDPTDISKYLHFPSGDIYYIEEVKSDKIIAINLVGYLPSTSSIKKYTNIIPLQDGKEIVDPEITDNFDESLYKTKFDERAILVKTLMDSFTIIDVDQYLILKNGILYRIVKYIDNNTIIAVEFGFIPFNLECVKIYAQLNFDYELIPANIQINTINSQTDIFKDKNTSQILIWSKNQIFVINKMISANQVQVKYVGRLKENFIEQDKLTFFDPTNVALGSFRFIFDINTKTPSITYPESYDINIQELKYPAIKILLNDTSKYYNFKNLLIKRVILNAQVKGLTNLKMRNDFTILDPKVPANPFGVTPVKRAGFYLSHEELCNKPISALSFNLKWMDLPDNFADYYKAYSDSKLATDIANDSFKVKISYIDQAIQLSLKEEINLFNYTDVGVLLETSNLSLDEINFKNDPVYELNPNELDPINYPRYFKIELIENDFQHKIYPLVINKLILEKNNTIVFPPYTPLIQNISIDYTSNEIVDLTNTSMNTEDIQVFSLHPYGYQKFNDALLNNQGLPLLPEYSNRGYLYLGIHNLNPSDTLSLFFQTIGGSLDNVPQLTWSYLTNTSWVKLSAGQVLFDATANLSNSGIIQFVIPNDASKQSSLMPKGMCWLCATLTENDTVADILDICTQAGIATFNPQNEDQENALKPLPPDSIKGLIVYNANIKRVRQPYSSFGGRTKESQIQLWSRTSERLRHKQRAISTWDYERIVLEAFPEIYKVKCLDQTNQNIVAGTAQVTLVVVPDINNTAPFLPLQPKISSYTLQAITKYVSQYISPFVLLKVVNPRYEQIKYRINVKFKVGLDKGYYIRQLNEDVKQFLTPWAYEKEADIAFGGAIDGALLINYLENQIYVDQVLSLRLIEQAIFDNNQQLIKDFVIIDENLAKVHYADSILVSANEHYIETQYDADYREEYYEGIGTMVVGVDFKVY